MQNIILSEIYFKGVSEPEIGGTYFYFDKKKGMGIPVIILERNGTNFYYWRNLLTGQKECDYGNFYELKNREDEEDEEDED